ncbi:antimicrobial peptide ISAMP-like [Ixodes scapularis]|uniref:antimicrobial peptide ISAMP-like n=1 Tax=Ixodes scapularis TaxID=6945 RepID=UPI001A9DB6C1|nr:antimicrobial peptide ISAMP-like [Ixodes scapularis]
MRVLAIVIVSLLLLQSTYYVEPAPTWQPHPNRPKCERPCKQPQECKAPCKRCNNGWWGDSLCKTR